MLDRGSAGTLVVFVSSDQYNERTMFFGKKRLTETVKCAG